MATFPVIATPPQTSIGDIANWVCQRLNRNDVLDRATQNAVSAYVDVCGRVPFENLQFMTGELPTVSGQGVYDISSYNVAGIISIRFTFAPGQVIRLKRSHVRQFDVFQTIQSKPFMYARFNQTIELQPIPDSSSYTYRIRFWQFPSIDSSPTGFPGATTMLVTPLQWDTLFKYETLYRTYLDLDMYEKASYLMAPSALPRQATPKRVLNAEVGILPRLWNELMMTYQQREGADEDYSINPAQRSYTSTRGGY